MTGIKNSERPIIKVRGLHKYFGALHVIKGVNLDVGPGEVVVIIGPSGGGKSTFLRCLNFLEEPSAGTIEIDGIEVNTEQSVSQQHNLIREIRRRAAMVFQEFNLFPHMTVLDNIIEGAVTVKGMPKKQAIAKAEELLTRMDLLAKRDEFPARLAAGEQQRVAIARSLCMEPRIILFDDPTSAVDPILVREVVDVLARLANEGIAMIIVTHEPYLARNLADRVIFMDDGVWMEMLHQTNYFSIPRKSAHASS